MVSYVTRIESTSLMDGPPRLKHSNNLLQSGLLFTSPWSRTPAQSVEGEDLAFEADEIDICLFDAHRNYRPTSSFPKTKTVYEYLETKIGDGELVPNLDLSKWA